jgi:hypothetical protein
MALSTEDQIELAVQGAILLSNAAATAFTASPSEIPALGSSTLSWEVAHADDARIRLFVNGVQVEAVGERVVRPHITTRYVLQARALHAVKELASAIVSVDLQQCNDYLIIEAWIEGAVERMIEDSVDASSQVSFRAPLTVTVDPAPDNISISLPMIVDVPNFRNANLDVRLWANVHATDGRVGVSIYRIESDVSWEWWEHALSFGSTTFVQGGQELQAILVELAPPEQFQLHSAWTEVGGIILRACPRDAVGGELEPLPGLPAANRLPSEAASDGLPSH